MEVLQTATENERLGGIQSPQLPLHVQLRGIRAAISGAHRGVSSGCDTETAPDSEPR